MRYFVVPLLLFVVFKTTMAQTTVILSVNQNPELTFTGIPPDTTIISGDSIRLGSNLIVSGGSGNYTFLWAPSETISNPAILSPFAFPTDTTTYLLQVFDENGCSIILERKINVIPRFTVIPAITGITCNGAKDGLIDLMISNGIPPYSIEWSTGDTTHSITGLSPGTYSVSASDSFDLVYKDTFNISEPGALLIGYKLIDSVKNGRNAYFINLTVSGGTKPYSFLWSNNSTQEDILVNKTFGIYSVIVTDSNACQDSIRFSICEHFDTTEYVSICEGKNYLGWTTSGKYLRTLLSKQGCDSIVTTYLTVNPVYNITETISICQGGNYLNWETPGEYQRTLTSVLGCDSIVTTVLVVHDLYDVGEDIVICQGSNYNGWSKPGTYQRTLHSKFGCDSVVTTRLAVVPVYYSTEYKTICKGENYLGWTETGQYNRTVTSFYGCDSIVKTNLTVNPVFSSTEYVSVCEGENYLGWAKTGEYQRVIPSVFGCDSTVTTILTINPVFNTIFDITICEGENYMGWTKTGQYKQTFSSTSGCDSIITTNLSLNPVFNTTFHVSICEGKNYMGWTKTGQYQQSYKSVTGCDSIITIILTVNPVYLITENITICKGDNYLGWTEPGRYQRTLTSVLGCDSLVTTNISFFNAVTPQISVSGDTLTCKGNYLSYQWYFEDSKINNATSSQYIIGKSGNYYVTCVDANGCTQTSEKTKVVCSALQTILLGELNCTIFPNPNDGSFMFEIRGEIKEPVDILILDSSGKKVFQKGNIRIEGFYSGSVKLKLPNGVYSFTLSNGNRILTKQFIVR